LKWANKGAARAAVIAWAGVLRQLADVIQDYDEQIYPLA